MATPLRQVLDQFDHQDGSLSLGQIARELALEPAMLQEMLDYWVRKGKLRRSDCCPTGCGTCHCGDHCPFVVTLPQVYERVWTESERAAPGN